MKYIVHLILHVYRILHVILEHYGSPRRLAGGGRVYLIAYSLIDIIVLKIIHTKQCIIQEHCSPRRRRGASNTYIYFKHYSYTKHYCYLYTLQPPPTAGGQ